MFHMAACKGVSAMRPETQGKGRGGSQVSQNFCLNMALNTISMPSKHL